MTSVMDHYNTDIQTPLFGETQTWERVVNLAIGIISMVIVTITFISALVFPSWPPLPVNILFACCIIFVCAGNIALIYWYRQGDVDPKFRLLIYYNTFCIIVLCVTANLYVHEVG
ncbi:transmembrane protein 243-like [Diadema setosum]|uniref:transmembrane protein 243-like n=1 Tax=Diadema antillarum TaxID=105358 RepID=UPI003A88142A